MKRLLLLTFVLCMVSLLVVNSAQAQFKFGVRQHSFHNSILPSDQTLGAYFGFAVGPRADLIFGADYWNYKLTLSTTLPAELGGGTTDADVKAGSMLLHGGLKFYMAEHEKGEVTSYVMGEFFKGFGTASVGAEGIDVNLDPIKDFLSPYGFTAAFGAEYFADDNFSVGGEIGLRYVITKSKGSTGLLDLLGGLINTGGSLKPAAYAQEADDSETKFTSMTIYTGLTVNFSF